MQNFFAGQIDQVEPVLTAVDVQHALKPNGRASVARLEPVRFDDRAQRDSGTMASRVARNSSHRVGLRQCS